VAGTSVASIVGNPSEQAAKMLVEADAGFLGDASGIGIQGLEKIPDLLLDLLPDYADRPTAWCNDLPWLDLVMHFPIHPYLSPEKLNLSFRGSCDPYRFVGDVQVSVWGEETKYPGRLC
jgi:hypothetical protein